MTKPKDKEWKIECSETVKEKMAADPEMAEAVREFNSRVWQAMRDFEAGKYASIDEALRSLGMEPMTDEEKSELNWNGERNGGSSGDH